MYISSHHSTCTHDRARVRRLGYYVYSMQYTMPERHNPSYYNTSDHSHMAGVETWWAVDPTPIGGGGAAPPGSRASGGPKTIFGHRVCITFHSGPRYINLGRKIYRNAIQTRGPTSITWPSASGAAPKSPARLPSYMELARHPPSATITPRRFTQARSETLKKMNFPRQPGRMPCNLKACERARHRACSKFIFADILKF